jgi:hypothetical protein
MSHLQYGFAARKNFWCLGDEHDECFNSPG